MAKLKVSNKNKKTLADKVVSWPLLVLLAIGISGFFIFKQIKQSHEKKMFTRIEANLKEFSVEVENKLGKPLAKHTIIFCNRTGVKHGAGKPYCGANTSMEYQSNSVDSSKTLDSRLQQVIDSYSQFQDTKLITQGERIDYWFKESLIYMVPNHACTLRVVHDIKKQPMTSKGNYGAFNFVISCTEDALKEYYPRNYITY